MNDNKHDSIGGSQAILVSVITIIGVLLVSHIISWSWWWVLLVPLGLHVLFFVIMASLITVTGRKAGSIMDKINHGRKTQKTRKS
jgi:CHASE2 domain-containing sensor protein